jgi:predicted secreted hydrolase
MKKFFALLSVLFCFSLLSAAVSYSDGYLPNTANKAITDTVATASANDTSYVFKNDAGYDNLEVVFKQGTTLLSFRIHKIKPEFVRFRYVAADSTLITEEYSLFGWKPLPIMLPDSTTTQYKYYLPVKSGTAVLAIKGDNNSYFIKQ